MGEREGVSLKLGSVVSCKRRHARPLVSTIQVGYLTPYLTSTCTFDITGPDTSPPADPPLGPAGPFQSCGERGIFVGYGPFTLGRSASKTTENRSRSSVARPLTSLVSTPLLPRSSLFQSPAPKPSHNNGKSSFPVPLSSIAHKNIIALQVVSGFLQHPQVSRVQP